MGIQCRLGAAAASLALGLAACGQNPPSAAAPAQTAASQAAAEAMPAIWFICDGIDAPTIFVVSEADAQKHVTIREYDKHAAALVHETQFTLGDGDGAAGSMYYPLTGAGGAEAGHLRSLNPAMLEDPAAAYTTPFTEIVLGDRDVSCRWQARTRLEGFSTRRSFVVLEDADGDLIYQTYDFANAAHAAQVNPDGAQRTTTFSLEVRGGAEDTGPEGAHFNFTNNGYGYEIRAPETGAASVRVTRNGAPVQTETLIAYQTPPKND